jgi:hypothetical protein
MASPAAAGMGSSMASRGAMKYTIQATIIYDHPNPSLTYDGLEMTAEEWAEDIKESMLDSRGFPEKLTITVAVASVQSEPSLPKTDEDADQS